jgi:glycosyltransferase involved in cell wall biosynthesis
MTIVSVLIPSYNHENYIEDCLQSVLEQTFQDFEIIITDDGSTDETVEKIKRFTDPRIQLFVHEKNQGASIAANHCFAKSNGKYIAMLSSDDIWLPEKLEKQVEYLEKHADISAVFSRVLWIDKLGNPLSQENCPYYDVFNVENRTRFEWLNHFFSHGNALCHPSSLIRRNNLESIGYLNPLFAALPDFDLWVRLCLNTNIFIMDEKLIRFRYFEDKSNASGDTYNGILRNRYEHRKILDNYLTITNIIDFQKIFPQIDLGSKEIKTKDLKFLLGKLSLDSGIEFKILWGLDQIYDYMQNESNIRRAKNIFGFAPLDLINLTGQNDVHNIKAQIELTKTQIEYRNYYQLENFDKHRKTNANNLIKRIKTKITLRKYVQLLNKSKFFDEEYYLNHNPDVKDSGINPAKHYLLFGGFEGRDPSPLFNSQWYLGTYRDVKINGINPLVHYLRFGNNEGRKIKKSNINQKQ